MQAVSAEIALVGIFHWHYHLNIEILYFYEKNFPGTVNNSGVNIENTDQGFN